MIIKQRSCLRKRHRFSILLQDMEIQRRTNKLRTIYFQLTVNELECYLKLSISITHANYIYDKLGVKSDTTDCTHNLVTLKMIRILRTFMKWIVSVYTFNPKSLISFDTFNIALCSKLLVVAPTKISFFSKIEHVLSVLHSLYLQAIILVSFSCIPPILLFKSNMCKFFLNC